MTENLTISGAPPVHPAMDYAFLRQEGIRRLERMAGRLWTDFNAHDPGITILEQLCYAITDLAYRIDYDLEDLLATEKKDQNRSLYTPAEILTTSPVTLNDLRKVVIDVPGVKNAWLEPLEEPEPPVFFDPSDQSLYLEAAPHRERLHVRGVWRVLIEADAGRSGTDPSAEVSRRLHDCRSLCQDFEPPIISPGQGITVSAIIEINEIEDPDRLLAEIYHRLARFISPRIRFYSLAEMLDRGKRIDEILDGPVLDHGFIDTEELERFERKKALRTSDLIQEIMAVEGVIAVRDISLSDGNRTEKWYLDLARDRTPFLDIEKSLFRAEGIRLVRGRIEGITDRERVRKIFDSLQKPARYEPLPESRRDLPLPAGRDRKVGHYHSIQHHFPAVYGIGEFGLPASASAERKARARQLKAFLMFFDQLLANTFAQLANVKALFSFHSRGSSTYFSQILDDSRLGLDEIRKSDRSAHEAALRKITENPCADPDGGERTPGYERKNRFLNHMLARFAEEFADYALLTHGRITKMDPAGDKSQKDLIEDKCAFLQDYGDIGYARGRAFDCSRPAWDTDNVSGLEKRISRKLGLSDYRRRELAGMDAGAEGGFHMVEHILLRPRNADKDQFTAAEVTPWETGALLALPPGEDRSRRKDPYSMQISFVFPDWIDRFKEEKKEETGRREGVRAFIWQTLREETPAHIGIHLHWLNQREMHEFEAAYRAWLESMST